MRRIRAMIAVVLTMALAVAVGPVAIATAMPAVPAHTFPYKLSVPRVAREVVVAGVAFEASGSVVPTISAGDTATVELRVYAVPSGAQVATVPTTLTADGTGWSASLSLPTAGNFALAAVVVKGGVVLGRSAARPMRATFPYRVTAPKVARPIVSVGAPFDATGSVVPTISPDDTSTTVQLQVWNLAGRSSLVATAPATLTGGGTGYSATLSLTSAGNYALVAVVLKGGDVVGRSDRSPVIAVLPYKVGKPYLRRPIVTAGQGFTVTGSVIPTVTADEASITIQVFRMRARGARSLVATAAGTFTGPVGRGTGYRATLSLPSTGSYTLVAVLTKGGLVVGKSEGRPMIAKAPVVARGGARH